MPEHPKSSPQTLDLNLIRRWSIVRPRLYRHMDDKYVESFFRDGSLRLSSFASFAKHPDEQLRDKAEGIGSRFSVGVGAIVMFSVLPFTILKTSESSLGILLALLLITLRALQTPSR
jgi:hypothetical protein